MVELIQSPPAWEHLDYSQDVLNTRPAAARNRFVTK
jgi:hypothetical protein